MARLLQIPFAKYHAVGNDFVVVSDTRVNRIRITRRNPIALASATQSDLARLAQSICERHTGLGADGLLLLLPPKLRQHSARMRVFNADGSEAEMSGNGIRCAAAYLARGGRSAPILSIETLAGVKRVRLRRNMPSGRRGTHNSGLVFQVEMGDPVFEPANIPFRSGDAKVPVIGFPLATLSGTVAATVTSMGNPHCSVFVDNFESIDWRAVGGEIERHELFPSRTNVEFIHVISRREIEVRFWERGVGHTQSSGTGSCAAALASILSGLTEREVRIRTLAGILEVNWPENGEVSLTGPAAWIAEGVYAYRPD